MMIRRICFRPSSFKLGPFLQRRCLSSFVRHETAVHINTLKTTFPYVWLRDSCQCRECVHPTTLQKLHKSSDIPLDIKPEEEELVGIQSMFPPESPPGLWIQWAPTAGQNAHTSFYSASFLKHHSTPSNRSDFHYDLIPRPWTAADVSSILTKPDSRVLSVPYSMLDQPYRLRKAFKSLVRYGLLFIRGVPNEETSDEKCELRSLAKIFGEIRQTFYGETWDVRNVRDSKNIAYTNLDLGLHMDLLYFQHPPKYQILHCLRNRVEGGQSVFVDALQGALRLFETDPEAFGVLTSQPVHFQYINDGHHLHCAHPTIELDPLLRHNAGEASRINPTSIKHVNYSPPFQAPLSPSLPTSFYESLSKLNTLLEDPSSKFEYLLQEGDAVIFDNRRVLHARAAFHEKEAAGSIVDEGETSRWLKGCYLQEDAVLDKMRVLSTSLESAPRC